MKYVCGNDLLSRNDGIAAGCMVVSIKDVFNQFLGYYAVWSRGIHFWALVQTRIYSIQAWRQVTTYVEPPVADEYGLGELCSIWA